MYYFRSDLLEKKAVNVNVPHEKVMACLNESTLDPYLTVKADFQAIMKDIHLNRYYHNVTQNLRQELARYSSVDASQIVMGNGADEMLYFLFTAIRDQASHYALAPRPSYFDYKSYCDAVGLNIRFFDLKSDFSLSHCQINLLANNPDCKLLILCNPNNPTGNLFPRADLIKLIEANQQRLVLVDETYFEFSQSTLADQLSRYPNLVIIRTFSKAFSAAGLRFGYLLASPENCAEIKKVVTAFNLSLFTQALALAILYNKEIFLKHNQMVINQRELLISRLREIPGITAYDSSTNFILFRYKYSIDLFHYFIENEFALRNVGDSGILKNCLRYSLAEESVNREFLTLIKRFCYEKV